MGVSLGAAFDDSPADFLEEFFALLGACAESGKDKTVGTSTSAVQREIAKEHKVECSANRIIEPINESLKKCLEKAGLAAQDTKFIPIINI